jgi:hypothetical protein
MYGRVLVSFLFKNNVAYAKFSARHKRAAFVVAHDKTASCSSIDQGSGKRRDGIR